ncbi:MAG: HalOD1 output domain-containing protein [Haloarculaceae archaeon]
MTYQPAQDRYETSFNPVEQAASMAAVDALSAVRHQDPTGMRPLHDAVDTEALDALIDRGRDDVTVSFSVESFGVTVAGNGCVTIEPPE